MTTPNRKHGSAEEKHEFALRDMLAPFFRHRRIVIVTFCAIFVAAILVAWIWAANYYVSTMQVAVEQDRSDPAVTSAEVANVNNNKPITLDQVTSEVTLLQGDDMLRKVVATCSLATPSVMEFSSQ